MLRLICGSALYVRGDPYETSDSVFGVKSSLIVDITKLSDTDISHAVLATKHGMQFGDWMLQKDFVLTTNEENTKLRVKQAEEMLRKLGSRAKLVDGLPVADDLD